MDVGVGWGVGGEATKMNAQGTKNIKELVINNK